MDDNLKPIYDDFINLLEGAEQLQRNLHDQALYIEEAELSQRVQNETWVKIRLIRRTITEFAKMIGALDEANLFREGSRASENLLLTFSSEGEAVKSEDEGTMRSGALEEAPRRVSLRLFSSTYDLADYTDVLFQVCKVLVITHPYVIAGLDTVMRLNQPEVNFTYNPDLLGDAKGKLPNGLWIRLDGSNEEILEICKEVLILCGYDQNLMEVSEPL